MRVVVIVATLTLALATAAEAAAPEKPKVLVLDFRDDGVGEQAVRIAHDTMAAHLSRNPSVDVISSEDVRRVADVGAQKMAIGCADDTCLAEIAGALGAQLLVYGTAGKLGDLVVVNVSLYDAAQGRGIGRETIEVARLDDLPGPLRAAGDRLLAGIGVDAVVDAPALFAPGPLFWIGAGTVAAGAAGAIAFASLSASNAALVKTAPTFDEKSLAKGAEEDFGAAAWVSAGVVIVGAGVLAASFVLE